MVADSLAALPGRGPSNLIVAALRPEARSALLAAAERVQLAQHQVLTDVDDPIQFVYFPLDAVVSGTNVLLDGRIIEAVTTGHEGMTGLPLALGVQTASMRETDQVPGDALRVGARAFVELINGLPELRAQALRYADVVMKMLSQTLACNRVHDVEQRMARWLLITQDRVERPRVMLTHELLSQMLGTHRPTVTLALQSMERAGLVRPERGAVTVLDREGLEQMSCECYAAIRTRLDAYYRSLTRNE